MCKKSDQYEVKKCLCCLPLSFAMKFFTFVFTCDWISGTINMIKTDEHSVLTTTFWFLLKTNLITSFLMMWTNRESLEARTILLRSFGIQYACEVITFLGYYIYMVGSDEIDRQCARWQADETYNF